MDETRHKLLSDMGYSQKAISIIDSNLNIRRIADPSITEQHQGSCGDIMILSLKIHQDKIQDAGYDYIGCAGLQACASAITEMIRGLSIDQAQNLDVSDIISYLEGIPEKKYECAEIARDTLRKAIKNWINPGLSVL